jgi:hypothetical protein
VRRDIEMSVALGDMLDTSRADAGLSSQAIFRGRMNGGIMNMQSRFAFDIPPDLLATIREHWQMEAGRTRRTDAELADDVERARARATAEAAYRPELLAQNTPPSYRPLFMRYRALTYRAELAAIDRGQADAQTLLAADRARTHYVPTEHQRRISRTPGLYTALDGSQSDPGNDVRRNGTFNLRYEWRHVAYCRMRLAMVDAIRHHRTHGRWPDLIAALGEPEQRLDPFAVDGAALRMRVDDQGRLRIWSIDDDQGDDGGWLREDFAENERRPKSDDIVIIQPPPGWQPPPPAAEEATP